MTETNHTVEGEDRSRQMFAMLLPEPLLPQGQEWIWYLSNTNRSHTEPGGELLELNEIHTRLWFSLCSKTTSRGFSSYVSLVIHGESESQGGKHFVWVCLFAYSQDYTKTTQPIIIKLCGAMGHVPGKKPWNVGVEQWFQIYLFFSLSLKVFQYLYYFFRE